MADTPNDLVVYLAAQGDGVASTTLFAGDLPADPKLTQTFLIAIREYPSRGPEWLMTPETKKPSSEFPRCQVLVKATTPDAGRSKAQAVLERLAQVSSQTVNSTFYVSVTPLCSVYAHSSDAQNRQVWAFNLEVERSI